MAEHFLDTETRQDLPFTALSCLGAGMDAATAEHHWLRGVAPTVGPNLLQVAGEWSGWDEQWLFERVDRQLGGSGSYWWRWFAPKSRDYLRGVVAFMALLQRVPDEAQQAEARLLGQLGRHYFDFGADPIPPDALQRARELQQSFLQAVGPCTLSEERSCCEARLQKALAGTDTARE